MMKNARSSESNKHKCAIQVLNEWLKPDYLRTEIEEEFAIGGFIKFRPDLCCYGEDGLIDIFEVVHNNEVSIWKQWKMFRYFEIHKWNVRVWRIDADWILDKCEKPNYLYKHRILET